MPPRVRLSRFGGWLGVPLQFLSRPRQKLLVGFRTNPRGTDSGHPRIQGQTRDTHESGSSPHGPEVGAEKGQVPGSVRGLVSRYNFCRGRDKNCWPDSGQVPVGGVRDSIRGTRAAGADARAGAGWDDRGCLGFFPGPGRAGTIVDVSVSFSDSSVDVSDSHRPCRRGGVYMGEYGDESETVLALHGERRRLAPASRSGAGDRLRARLRASSGPRCGCPRCGSSGCLPGARRPPCRGGHTGWRSGQNRGSGRSIPSP